MTATTKYLHAVVAGTLLVFGGWSFVVQRANTNLLCKNLELSEKVENLSFERDVLEEELFDTKEQLKFAEATADGNFYIPYVTRGVRNKNPMNVVAMPSKNPWRGQIGKDNENHAIFETFEHGLRAGYLTLRRYYEKHGINTLIGITTRFCEGNAHAYAKFIARNIGVKPDEPINVLDYMPEIMKSMVRFENGFDIFPDTYFIPYYNR